MNVRLRYGISMTSSFLKEVMQKAASLSLLAVSFHLFLSRNLNDTAIPAMTGYAKREQDVIVTKTIARGERRDEKQQIK